MSHGAVVAVGHWGSPGYLLASPMKGVHRRLWMVLGAVLVDFREAVLPLFSGIHGTLPQPGQTM